MKNTVVCVSATEPLSGRMSDHPTVPSRKACGARCAPLLGPPDTTTGTSERSGGGNVMAGSVAGGTVVGVVVVGGNVDVVAEVDVVVAVVDEVDVVDVVVIAATLLEFEV